MKNLNLLRKFWMLPLFCLALNAHAQSVGKDTKVTIGNTATEICEEPDEWPVYKGGPAALMSYLKNALKYPKTAQEMHVEGRVFVSYVVDEEGKTTNINPVAFDDCIGNDEKSIPQLALEKRMAKKKKMNPAAQEAYMEAIRELMIESIRIISQMPKAETPAMKDGKPVCCRMALPINFRIR